MRFYQTLTTVAAAALALTLIHSEAGAQEKKYTIKLKREFLPKQKFTVEYKLSDFQAMEMEVDGEPRIAPPGQDKNNTILLVGSEEIIEAKNGVRMKVQLTVKEFTTVGLGTGKEEVLEPGTKVDITYSKVVTFSIDGKPVSEIAAGALSNLYKLENEGMDMEKVFGSGDKKAVGETWKINSKVAAEGLLKQKVSISPEDIEGSMTLKEVVEHKGIKCLRIEGKLILKKIPAPLPPGFTNTGSGGEMTMSGLFPADNVRQPVFLSSSSSFKSQASGENREGAKIDITVSGKKEKAETRKMIK